MLEGDEDEGLNERAYARTDSTNAGDMLQADDGFTCLKAGEVVETKFDKNGLYVPCQNHGGRHYLDGQIEGEVYIGLYHFDGLGEG